jgi:hypothetical protein
MFFCSCFSCCCCCCGKEREIILSIVSESREVARTLLAERRLLVAAVIGTPRVGLVLAVRHVGVVFSQALGEGGRRTGFETLERQSCASDLKKTYKKKTFRKNLRGRKENRNLRNINVILSY